VSKLSVSALQQLHPNSARPFCSSSLIFFLVFFVHLTMAGPVDDVEHMPPQSPPMQHIIQALIHKVKTHMEGLDADVQVTNEKIGELEAT
jgi:hypothetical protein